MFEGKLKKNLLRTNEELCVLLGPPIESATTKEGKVQSSHHHGDMCFLSWLASKASCAISEEERIFLSNDLPWEIFVAFSYFLMTYLGAYFKQNTTRRPFLLFKKQTYIFTHVYTYMHK